ncbi:MAG TPA: BrnA antitoxin family protein [Burkholderiales bacterium]|nr:BrnA antitoxin family protein [Burkholderiales bacterium]
MRALREREGSKTDFAALRAKTEEELEADIASDPDWANIPRDWYRDAVLVAPGAKRLLSLRLDQDVVDWFKAQGPGYQTRINAVLRAFMEGRKTAKPVSRKRA